MSNPVAGPLILDYSRGVEWWMLACVAGGISVAREKSQAKSACVSGAAVSEIPACHIS